MPSAKTSGAKKNSRKQRVKLATTLRDTIVDLCVALNTVGHKSVADQITLHANLKNPIQLMADFQEPISDLRNSIPVNLLQEMGPTGQEYLNILQLYIPKNVIGGEIIGEQMTEVDAILAKAQPYLQKWNNPALNQIFASATEMKDESDLQTLARDCIAFMTQILVQTGGEIDQMSIMTQVMPFFQQKQVLIVNVITRLSDKVTAVMPKEELKTHFKDLIEKLGEEYPDIKQYASLLDGDSTQLMAMAGPLLASLGGPSAEDEAKKFEGVQIDWEQSLADQVGQLEIE